MNRLKYFPNKIQEQKLTGELLIEALEQLKLGIEENEVEHNKNKIVIGKMLIKDRQLELSISLNFE